MNSRLTLTPDTPKIFQLIDRIQAKADRSNPNAYGIAEAISQKVPAFQIIQTIKKGIVKDRSLMVGIFGEDLVTDIAKF